jgi:hypothetical protein
MKKIIASIIGALMALTLPLAASAQSPTYTAQSGVTFWVQQAATATSVTGAVRLPTFSGAGTLTVIGAGITGSPSGCTIALAYQSNGGGAATSAVSTTSFTPASSTQTFTISPSVATGDNYIATYACSSTYPTAGTITASFSPAITSTVASGSVSIVTTGDPCRNPNVAKSTVAIAVTTAATTQLVAPSGTKAVYLCSLQANVVGTSPTLLVEYGTSTTCVGTTALTGTIPVATGTYFSTGNDSAIATPASQGLCLVSGGTLTTTGVQGFATYVQQ